MAEEFYLGKNLSKITQRCRELTISEMLRNANEVKRNNRMGFGHYMFDGVHAPRDKWTIPGVLDYDVLKYEDGVEIAFKVGPFEREEISIHVEEGLLEVEALHEENDQEAGTGRRVRVSKHLPVPFEFDIDDVNARFEREVLVIRIPKSIKPRRRVEID
jgi:HSP20 family molecular chaperone IbpA